MLPPGLFTAAYVVGELEAAGQILSLLESRRATLKSIEKAEPGAIARATRVFGWLSLIPKNYPGNAKYIVQMRSMGSRTRKHRCTWVRLGEILGCDYRVCQRLHAQGIATIVEQLNEPGLCAAAGGSIGPSPPMVADMIARSRCRTAAPSAALVAAN